MNTQLDFIKKKYLIIAGGYWATFLWLGIYFNGGFGEITDAYSHLMIAIGNGGVSLMLGRLLLSKNLQKQVTKEDMKFEYNGVIILLLFMASFTILSIFLLLGARAR
jgi:hypothetical protein